MQHPVRIPMPVAGRARGSHAGILALVAILGTAPLAHGQMAPPRAAPSPITTLLAPAAGSIPPAPAAAADEDDIPIVIAGLRAGSFSMTDGDSDDTYGLLPLIGVDGKVHFGPIPLAAQLSFDWSFGEGDIDDLPSQVIDSDAEITLYAWRLSALVEPPGGWLGLPGGSISLTPYAGGGVGLHVLDEDVDAETMAGEQSESATENVLGYHLIAGIDVVFKNAVSVGVEVLWTTTEKAENALEDDIDIGGLGGTVTFRIHF